MGTALGLRLAARGWRAVGVRRHADALPAPIDSLSLDLSDPGDVQLPAVDAVVVTLTADGRDAPAYERTYLGGLRGLRRAAGGQQPRVVLVSSTGVLGGEDGELVTEATPPDPQRPTAHVLLAAEELAALLFPNLVIVRPAGIYGPGRTSLVERVRGGAPLAHRRVTNRIHRDDLVTVLATVLEIESPPRLLHAVDDDAARLGDVAAHLAGLLGVPVPPDSEPMEGAPSSVGSGGPGSEPALVDSGGTARGPALGKIVDGTLVHSLVPDVEWQYPTFREGYEAMLAETLSDPETSPDAHDGAGHDAPRGGSGLSAEDLGCGTASAAGQPVRDVRPAGNGA